MNVNKVVLVCFITCSSVYYVSSYGDKCLDKKLSKPGKCININFCPTAIENLKIGEIPQNCGFEGLVPLVCCVDNTNVPEIIRIPGRKSIDKCNEYGVQVKNLIINRCKIPGPYPLINNENGLPAENTEFPHMAALGYQAENGSIVYSCAGSLISEDFILTAAHCCNSRESGKPVVVRLGDTNLDSNEGDEGSQTIEILKIIVHPDYKPISYYNDIALIKLKKPAQFLENVYPACLNTANQEPRPALAIGWGEKWGNSDKVQMKIQLETYPHKKCASYFEVNDRKLKNGISNETQLCAGSKQQIKYLCRDDSGASLVDLSETFCMYNLIGVTSIGDACVLEIRPRVYSRVTHYISWIEDIVWT